MPGTAVITGASAGVGRATARALADAGYDLGLIARGRQGLEATATEVRERGSDAAVVQADVADPEALEQAATQIESDHGPIDVWVNNAMVTVYGQFRDVGIDEFRRVIDVTMLGSVWGTRTALRRMRERGEGTIVQVGSALAYRGIPIQSAYCTAKHGLKGFVESVRTELEHADSDVRFVQVHLPGLNTPQFQWGRKKFEADPQPVPPIYQPEVAAEGIRHAIHSDRDELWVGGSTAYTIWGERTASGLLDRYMASTGVSGQKTDQPETRADDGNLFDPVEGDFGAHGPFDDQAHDVSLYLEATKRRGWVLGGLAALGAAAAAGIGAWLRD